MKATEFTPSQLVHWKMFEEVRSSGRYNMFDSRAVALSGLSASEYDFVLDNYTNLKQAVELAGRPAEDQ